MNRYKHSQTQTRDPVDDKRQVIWIVLYSHTRLPDRLDGFGPQYQCDCCIKRYCQIDQPSVQTCHFSENVTQSNRCVHNYGNDEKPVEDYPGDVSANSSDYF